MIVNRCCISPYLGLAVSAFEAISDSVSELQHSAASPRELCLCAVDVVCPPRLHLRRALPAGTGTRLPQALTSQVCKLFTKQGSTLDRRVGSGGLTESASGRAPVSTQLHIHHHASDLRPCLRAPGKACVAMVVTALVEGKASGSAWPGTFIYFYFTLINHIVYFFSSIFFFSFLPFLYLTFYVNFYCFKFFLYVI